MKITRTRLKQIIKEELAQTPAIQSSPFGPRPSEAPTKFTTAELDPEQFIQMIDAWGAPESGSKHTAESIYKKLGGDVQKGRQQLAQNYDVLKKRMESESKGKLPRKYMPVVKKAFIEDLFNRLKKGKLDWADPYAKSSKKASGKGGYKGDHGAGKPGRVKSKKTRKLAAQSIQEEGLVREALLPLIKEILFEKFGYGRGDYSPQEREQYAQYLPSKNFPSLEDFGAMPDPEKSKNYWLNKGELDGDKKDDQLSPHFGVMGVDELHPSQDRVYADKIGWKLLEYGAGVVAPLKDPDLVDPNTGETAAPDWRYRSIVIKGGLLLDGHHKWALASLSGKDAKVPVLYLPQLDLPTTINLLRSYGAAQGFAGQA